MKLPVIRGILDRRILANFSIDPDVLARLLPAPFRPKSINGRAIGGICLIRLKDVRARWVPSILGFSSENAAHRFAVEWESNGQLFEGVYIPRRDTSSRLNALLGGRVFPGAHHRARFRVHESDDHYSVELNSYDRATHVRVDGHPANGIPATSVFRSLGEASAFFERGSLGYSASANPSVYEGLELRMGRWEVEPLEVSCVESSYFEDSSLFPAGSTQFDCALLMRGIDHEWHDRGELCCPTAEAQS